MAKWTRIPAPALPRSSHSLSLIGGKAYIFGGEIKAREPVDNAWHVVDIASGKYESVTAPNAPPARVGHAAGVIGNTIYVFGGRSVADMGAALDEKGAVHAFDTRTGSWSTLAPSSERYPCARSYHAATTLGGQLVIHAGCGADAAAESSSPAGEKGRLWDVWAFEPASRTWSRLPDAPAPPRGGTSLAALSGRLYRFGGFSGVTELGGEVDSLSLSKEGGAWETSKFGEAVGEARGGDAALARTGAGPGARSVAGLHGVDGRLVAFYGEGRPSPTGGHDAAGKFWNDVWAYDGQWAEITPKDGPTPRGWFASDAAGGRVVVWGGLDDANERMGDGWVLTL